jgi:threonine/homoserine/homoserine lactone efflux protein
VLLGAGAALSVGPIFVPIVQEAATRGFGASLRVILGSATPDAEVLATAPCRRSGGALMLFTVTWFVVACGLEAIIVLVVARSGKRRRPGTGFLTGGSAILFIALAAVLLVRDVVPDLLPG